MWLGDTDGSHSQNFSPRADVSVPRPAVRDSLAETLLPELRTVHDQAATDLSSLTQKLRLVCRDAHRQGMRAEHVVILVKQLWAQITTMNGHPIHYTQSDRLHDVVTLAIDEYYRSKHPTP